MIPISVGVDICGYTPQYRCQCQGQTYCLYPVSQNKTVVQNYITINNTTNINIITPTPDIPRPIPEPVRPGTNTGGSGDVTDNHNGAVGATTPVVQILPAVVAQPATILVVAVLVATTPVAQANGVVVTTSRMFRLKIGITNQNQANLLKTRMLVRGTITVGLKSKCNKVGVHHNRNRVTRKILDVIWKDHTDKIRKTGKTMSMLGATTTANLLAAVILGCRNSHGSPSHSRASRR
jgi:hypothetical protein